MSKQLSADDLAQIKAYLDDEGFIDDELAEGLFSHIEFLTRERDAYRKAKQENDDRFSYERDEARRDRDEFASRVVAAETLHQPVEQGAQGFDESGNYTYIKPCCTTCGNADDMAVRWPCATKRALDGKESTS